MVPRSDCPNTEPDSAAHRTIAANEKRTRILSPLPTKTKQSDVRSEEHTSELQSQSNLVCRLLLEKKQTRLTRTLLLRLMWSSIAFVTTPSPLPLSRAELVAPLMARLSRSVNPPVYTIAVVYSAHT